MPNSSGGDDDGWFEDLVDGATNFVTGFVDGVASLVNEASAFWQKLQDLAVEAVASALNDLSDIVSCDATCKAALQAGLEIGLASMGIPPSLPSFTSRGPGARLPRRESRGTGWHSRGRRNPRQGHRGGGSTGHEEQGPFPGLPTLASPEIGIQPAVLTLRVFSDAGPLAKGPLLFLGQSNVFTGDQVWLPKALPAPDSMSVPIVLSPRLGGLPDPPANASSYAQARHYKALWRDQRLAGGCARMNVPMLSIGRIDLLLDAAVRAEFFGFLTTGTFPCQP